MKTTTDYLNQQAAAMLEKGRGGLQEKVRQACACRGIKMYHTWNSRKSAPGFPDCVIVLGDHIVYAELKREKARPSKAQVEWLDALSSRGHIVYLWRPHHWFNGSIDVVLGGNLFLGDLTFGLWFAGVGVHGDKFSLPAGRKGGE